MQQDITTVREHYNANAEREWSRLDEHPFEFIFTTHMMEQYVREGDRILDIGGGPGRYAIHFAKRGCDVTLVDLSEENVRVALDKAKEANVSIRAMVANCLALDPQTLGEFDHVFLMGPLYHLLDPADQKSAVEIALSHLKLGGILYVSFIQVFAGILFSLKNKGTIVPVSTDPTANVLIDDVINGNDYCGPAFTKACFTHSRNILPFMEQFPLEKLHLFGQEGILAPNEAELLQRDQEEIDCWIEIAKKYLDLPELLSYSEHAMYIGKKL
jgi:2-polyprenyl-3-methyl-5-hydroxy-6-metoxy-1,4-benzoquinol methylase